METSATITTNTSTAFKQSHRRPFIKSAGTWDTATATVSINGVDLNTTYTADFELQLEIDEPVNVQVTVSSVGGSTSLKFYVFG